MGDYSRSAQRACARSVVSRHKQQATWGWRQTETGSSGWRKCNSGISTASTPSLEHDASASDHRGLGEGKSLYGVRCTSTELCLSSVAESMTDGAQSQRQAAGLGIAGEGSGELGYGDPRWGVAGSGTRF